VFLVHASGGSTEYYLTETVFNDSGIDWNAFHLQLGLGIGDMFTFGPVAIPELALPRFDFPSSDPAPTASLLTTSMNVGYQLDWTGGVVPSGATLNLTFSIDVPDDQLNNYSQFTLRQIPQAVPEPATAILLSLGGLAVGCHRQRPVRKSSERSSVAESRQFSVRQFRAWPEQRNSRVDVV